MPKMVSEISAGQTFEYSLEDSSLASTQTRAFKVLLNAAGEVFAIQPTCGVFIGDRHPYNDNIYCVSYSAAFDGDSRMVVNCTFNYKAKAGGGSNAGEDPSSKPPDQRPALWTTSASLEQVPLYTWKPQGGAPGAGGNFTAPLNPAGDPYEGLTKLEPVVTITIQQYQDADPTSNLQFVGTVNSGQFVVRTLTFNPREVLLRGLQYEPVVEQYGEATYRGWKATYEFLYRPNYVGLPINANIGWDIAVPQSGFNIKNISARIGAADTQKGSFMLQWDENPTTGARQIKGWPGAVDVVAGTDNTRVPGMLLLAEGINPLQVRCSSPIPLNNDGTPRAETADPKVLVYRYQIYRDSWPDFTGAPFNLILE
jgi:hypothetical protein